MKKALSILLFATMIISLFAFSTSAAWDGTSASSSLKGEGTQDSPYLVETAEDLAFLAKSVNEGNSYDGKYIIQTADIDLGGKEWTPIGFQDINDAKTDGKAAAPFSGVYSGLGHKVTGLSITEETTNHLGLFGYTPMRRWWRFCKAYWSATPYHAPHEFEPRRYHFRTPWSKQQRR